MRKLLAIAAVAAMVPVSAFARTAITDSEMGKVTGQSGVSIDMDVRLDIKADTIAWGNSDGSGTTSWIGMKNLAIDNLTVKLRPDLLGAVVLSTMIDGAIAGGAPDVATAAGALKAGYAATHTADEIALYNAQVDAVAAQRGVGATTALFIGAVKPLTIDVATTAAVSGNKSAGTTYVSIGLGSLNLAAQSITFDVALGSTNGTAPTNAQLNQTLGAVGIYGLNIDVNGTSKFDIYALNKMNGRSAAGSGVVFDLDVTIDKLTASAISWGNAAGTVTGPTTLALGAPATTTGGYVGLANLNIGNLTVMGPVSIQVGTIAASATAVTDFNAVMLNPASTPTQQALAVTQYYYALYTPLNMGTSFVQIGLGSGNSSSGATLNGSGNAANGAVVLGIGSLTADVKVADNAGLTGGGTYGSVSMSNLKVGVNGWVNIGAH